MQNLRENSFEMKRNLNSSESARINLPTVAGHRYVKCRVHFFGWNIFHLLSYEQNLLTKTNEHKEN